MYEYKDRYFSVLGDSISTLEGYSIPEYAAFYDTEHKLLSGIYTPADTWWGRVIKALGGELLVNQSFSGSTVCRRPEFEIPSYACSDERTSSLHRDGLLPFVIMVFMGINDWGFGAVPDDADGERTGDLTVFSVAYGVMLEKLIRNYPKAEIWCFTFPMGKQRNGGSFPYCYGGKHIEAYCDVIRRLARQYGCRLVDLYRYAESYGAIDGFHPNADGMRTIADAVLAEVGRAPAVGIIDSHVHYAHARYGTEFPYLCTDGEGYGVRRADRETLLRDMKESGIVGFIEPSIGFDAIENQLSLVCAHGDSMWAALGIHPTRCIRTPLKNRNLLREYAVRGEAIAIGETGLDYHYPRMKQHRLRQRMWFIYQIKLADLLGLPLILHVRDADRDALHILKKYKDRLHGGVIHCFSGDLACAQEYISLGFVLGIGGKLLADDERAQVLSQAVKGVALSDLVVETDAPFVLPDTGELSCSGKQRRKLCNSSLVLPLVIGRIAAIRAEDPSVVRQAVYRNTVRVFGLRMKGDPGNV